MQKPSESVFCSYVMAHYGIFICIASETRLKRWTVPLENTDRSHLGVS